jgi:PAS domain-containing protein
MRIPGGAGDSSSPAGPGDLPDAETTGTDRKEGDSMNTFSNLVSRNEERLMEKILEYARTRGYTKYTSTLREAWRLSISGISASLIAATGGDTPDLELTPDEDCVQDPATQFGVIEAKRHREQGVSLQMFLGLMKYYRQTYKDLVIESSLEPHERARSLLLVERFFDRMEIGFCSEWATSKEQELLSELQAANRLMTNEKNKYLTTFESLPNPVFIVDAQNRIESMNLAATLLFEETGTPGAKYYTSPEKTPPAAHEPASRPSIGLLLPWILEEMQAFAYAGGDRHSVEKAVTTREGERIFQVRLSRMLDVSGKFEGTILILRDVTLQKKVEEERIKKEKLEAILEIAGAICHELNQPLQGLFGNAELLLMDFDHQDPRFGRISKISELAHQMAKITKQLSGITRYETMDYLKSRIIDIKKASGFPAEAGTSQPS